MVAKSSLETANKLLLLSQLSDESISQCCAGRLDRRCPQDTGNPKQENNFSERLID